MAIENKKLFRPSFKDLKTWSAWFTALKALFGLSMTETDLKLFKECTGRSQAPDGPFRELWAIVGRRGGKPRRPHKRGNSTEVARIRLAGGRCRRIPGREAGSGAPPTACLHAVSRRATPTHPSSAPPAVEPDYFGVASTVGTLWKYAI